MKALYAVNLIEANLNHYDGKSNAWKDANLNEILAKIEAGDNERPATFGQRMYRVAFMSGDFWETAWTLIHWDVVDARNHEAHKGVNVDHWMGEKFDGLVEKLEEHAKVKTGKNFESLEELVELDRTLYRRLLHETNIPLPNSTLGQNVIFWARQGTFKKSTLNWMWKLNNIRNKHIHTGRALTKADREFLATVPERIDALLNKLAAR
jgi:hypothetical protein